MDPSLLPAAMGRLGSSFGMVIGQEKYSLFKLEVFRSEIDHTHTHTHNW